MTIMYKPGIQTATSQQLSLTTHILHVS